MRLLAIAVLCPLFAAPTAAQEQDEWISDFSRIKGGAVYDFKEGLDGASVSDEYLLTHIVCFDGRRVVQVMIPAGPEDDGTAFTMDGVKSTLKRQSETVYRADFTARGKRFHKGMELKPVNDNASHYKKQFIFPVEYGDELWKAMTSGKPGEAMMLIGTGGMPVALPNDQKLTAALKSCGLSG